jgi:uncharacterized membrane protein
LIRVAAALALILAAVALPALAMQPRAKKLLFISVIGTGGPAPVATSFLQLEAGAGYLLQEDLSKIVVTN